MKKRIPKGSYIIMPKRNTPTFIFETLRDMFLDESDFVKYMTYGEFEKENPPQEKK